MEMSLAGEVADEDGPIEFGKELARAGPPAWRPLISARDLLFPARGLSANTSRKFPACVISRKLLKTQARPGVMPAIPGLQIPHPSDKPPFWRKACSQSQA